MIKLKSICFLLASFFLAANGIGQTKNLSSSNDIYHAMQKLNTLANVLYVAAHPDDENTRMISYFSNVLHANTAYFSFTRGDGGQNLIGTEIGDLLGVLRTHELLQARSIDGGEQYFSRAIDFGYSKHPDETLSIWDKDLAMSDIIQVIRTFKPDIIINRFDHRTPGKTHGHHTSSAMLSLEVFEMAGDKSVYPEQLSFTQPWQASRLFFNTSWWFYGSREKFAKADKSNLISMDIGTYIPLLGQSNGEIASAARSMHKCQGFGSAGSRASRQEYLEIIKGTNPAPSNSPFEGIDITWSRVKGGQAVKDELAKVITDFDFTSPAKSVKPLLQVYELIEKTADPYWKTKKLKELEAIIVACSGLYLDGFVDVHRASMGDSIELKIEATNQSETNIDLQSYNVSPAIVSKSINSELLKGEEQIFYEVIAIQKPLAYTNPYWLNNKHSLGSYQVNDVNLIGKPVSDAAMQITFNIVVEGKNLSITRDVTHKYVEPSFGEITKPFEIIPEVSVALSDDVYIFADTDERTIPVELQAGKNDIEGEVSLEVPKGWKVSPKSQSWSFEFKGEKQIVEFTLTPPNDRSVASIKPVATIGSSSFTKTSHTISYDHIAEQTVSLDASAVVSRIPLIKRGKEQVAYIMGAGDKIPEALENMGYEVDILDPKEGLENLSQYQAILIGIRAYNTVEEMNIVQAKLFDYAENGGNLITQYNTTWRLKSEDLAPYPIQLSRDRVCQEDAEVRVLKPNHPCMFYPNQIGEEDWDGWVQERGLYFPNEWSEEYEAILSMNDAGEDAKEGSLLVAPHGDGYFVYTGISFFRELPAGVPGAYRLLANLISLGTNKR